MHSILLKSQDRTPIATRRFPPQMGINTAICFSTMPTTIKSGTQNSQRPSLNHCSSGAQTTMILLPDKDVNSDSSTTSDVERFLDPERGQNTPSQFGHASPDGVAAAWFHQVEIKCSEQVKPILLNSRKPSTHKAYTQKWKRFDKWCQAKLTNTSSAPLPRVLEHLLKLKTSGLSMSSIKAHLTAISALHQKTEG